MPDAVIAAGPPRSRVSSVAARSVSVIGWTIAVISGVSIWAAALWLVG